jgi:hypothetical protein
VVQAWRIDKNGELAELNQVASGGAGPVYLRAHQRLIAQCAGFGIDGKAIQTFAIRIIGTNPGDQGVTMPTARHLLVASLSLLAAGAAAQTHYAWIGACTTPFSTSLAAYSVLPSRDTVSCATFGNELTSATARHLLVASLSLLAAGAAAQTHYAWIGTYNPNGEGLYGVGGKALLH